jgi:hypothetical protein
LREWPNDKVSQDGRLDSAPLRPICWLEVPPGISIGAKRQLVSRISDAISEAYRQDGLLASENPMVLESLEGMM